MIKKIVASFLQLMAVLPSIIYDIFISRIFTLYAHYFLMQYMQQKIDLKKVKRFLDIGIGTGLPLFKIRPRLPQDLRILGVDIDQSYVNSAQNLFKNDQTVEIRFQDFYLLDQLVEGKFDIVYFSFSFMLMPDKIKALERAKSLLNQNGHIIMMLSLSEQKSYLKEKLKPIIQYFTSVDFGNIVYENELIEIIKSASLQILQKKRVQRKYNPLWKIFNVNLIHCSIDDN